MVNSIIYNDYEDKNVNEIYEIFFASDRDLYWTGDGITTVEYAAIKYKDKEAAKNIAKKLKDIYELQWGMTTEIMLATIDVKENLYIREEEVK